MRRRPMEFWWIAAYCVARATLVFSGCRGLSRETDYVIFSGYGSALLFVPFLLFFFLPYGRWLGTTVLGVEAVELMRRTFEGLELNSGIELEAMLALGFCIWMAVYLQRPSTARLFQPHSARANAAPISYTAGLDLFSVVEVVVAVAVGWGAKVLGAPVWLAAAAGVGAYFVYGQLLEEWLRQRWDSLFASIETGFPESEAGRWRSACSALARNQTAAARTHFERLTLQARTHPAGRLFEMALSWQELLSHAPTDGCQAFRRTAFDHAFAPLESDRKRIAKYVDRTGDEELRKVAHERAEFIAALAQAASNPASFFRARADRMLARITGEAFAFNAPESWGLWWREKGEHWSGDAALVSVVARLLYRDCYTAAVDLAHKAAGRAEEPLLVELTEQMLFFISMREAQQGSGVPAPFMQHPMRVLLVPEWTDAAGWLHADSPVLANMGVSRKATARRLMLRATLLDYVAAFWKRYPADLNADLPVLVQLLAGRHFGKMRPRVKFEAWWPTMRAAFIGHARSTISGLNTFEKGDVPGAAREFEAVLRERRGDLSARYNLALCHIRRGDAKSAEKLLLELTEMEPKEPYWWMALGDLHRSESKTLPARTAYRRALKLGAAEGRVALHMGLTFAHEDRDGEAMKLFERALGKNPTVSKLEALAMTLENEGCWKLAGHYREEALRRELDAPPDHDSRERGDETAA